MSGWVDEQAPTLGRDPDGERVVDESVAQPRARREDRWAWRRRIRANPHRLRVYRCIVAAVGLLLILLGLATGWLPGPGGIPLILGGLAVWASEFHWARRLLAHARVHVHVFSRWARRRPVWQRWAGSAAGVLAVAALAYLYLVVLGTPGLLPEALTATLERLPGVER